MYADIGPGSFKSKNCVSTIDIQSHRVEYAQVNHGARSKTPKLELKDESKPTGPGTFIIIEGNMGNFGEVNLISDLVNFSRGKLHN